MTKKIISFSFFIFIFLSCQTDVQPKVERLDKTKSDQIDELAQRYLSLNRFSGAIVLAKGGEIVYDQNVGLADYQNQRPFSNTTAFKVGELTKLLTENLIDNLAKQGKLQRTDSISQHLPELPSNWTIQDVLKYKGRQSGGGATAKDTSDYNTLGKLIEQLSGKTYQENIEQYSKELDLENTYFQKADSSIAVGYLYHNYRGRGLELQKSPVINLQDAFSSKGLKSTPRDLLKVLKSNPSEVQIDGYLENDGFSYSLLNRPTDGLTIIILSNRRHPVAKEMSDSIEAILKGEKYKLPLAREPFPVDPNLLDSYSGRYALNENMSFEVVHENDSLFVLLGPNKVALIPQSDDQFYMQENDAAMRFEKDSTALVHKVVLLNGFVDSNQEAIRIE
ncbi:MAG: serine hydrolase [Bacteroidota bacterium]